MNKTDLFAAIRKATTFPEGYLRTELPEWDASILKSSQQPASAEKEAVWKTFCERFGAVNGETVAGLIELVAFLQEHSATYGYLAPELDASIGNALKTGTLKYETEFDDTRVDDYTYGITRAAGIVAETGSVVLKESSTSSRLGALAPWIHVTLIDDDTRYYPTLLDAVTDFGDEPYVVFATGPSKTADIEGILIEGVHGPGRQVCCLL